MSLFIVDLAFRGIPLMDTAKIAIITALLIAGLLGFCLLGGGKAFSQILENIKKRFRRITNPIINSEKK